MKNYWWDKVLTILLVIIALGGLGTLGYIIATPGVQETFTEFYILGSEGKATDYPDILKIGEEARMIIGIINHEQREMSYKVEVIISNKINYVIEPIDISNEEKWEAKIGFVPEEVGEKQKVEFVLYESDKASPLIEPLSLLIDVSE
jgi:uncharacterized membrane protein